MILEREGAAPLSGPSPKRISRELRRLRSSGRSSFASLTREDGAFLQVAGGGIGCLLEKHLPSESKLFRGYLDSPIVRFEDGTELSFSAGRVQLRRDEWFTIDQVIEVFEAYLRGTSEPAFLHWRDVSSILASGRD